MIIIPDEIRKNTEISDAAKILWSTIKQFNMQRIRLITRNTLSKETGKSKSTISRLIADLRAFNYLKVYDAGHGLERALIANLPCRCERKETSVALKKFYKEVFGND